MFGSIEEEVEQVCEHTVASGTQPRSGHAWGSRINFKHQFLRWGATGVFSDNPDRARDARDSYIRRQMHTENRSSLTVAILILLAANSAFLLAMVAAYVAVRQYRARGSFRRRIDPVPQAA